MNIHQEYYFSADPLIIQLRAKQVLEKFPLITVAWNGGTLSLRGELSITEYNELQKDLDSILAFKNNFTLDTKGVAIAQEKLNEVANQQQMLFQKALTEIQKAQFDFPVASAELDATQVEKTSQLADDLEDLLLLASINQYSLGIIIIGTADSLGASSANDEISQTRAEYVKSLLIENGIDNREIMAVGIGKIELEQVATTARKVLINVVYHQNTLVHTEQKGN